MKKYLPYIAWIIVFEAVSAYIGSLTQEGVDSWYKALQAPPMVPPNFVFPIMWTILYALIAICGCRLWQARGSYCNTPIPGVYTLYVAMNWAWSFIFFSAHAMLPALVWIVLLNILALDLIRMTWPRDRLVAKLMIPVTLWTLFATYLTAGYWYLNPAS